MQQRRTEGFGLLFKPNCFNNIFAAVDVRSFRPLTAVVSVRAEDKAALAITNNQLSAGKITQGLKATYKGQRLV